MKAHAPRAKARHYCSPAALLGAGIAALMLLAGAPARAATYTWTGTGTAAAARNWFTGSNWSGGSVPLATDMVIINSVNGPVLDSVSATAANIQIATAAGAAGRLELNNASLATTAANTFIATQSTGTAFIVMRDSTWTSSSDNINFGNNGRAVVDLFGSSTINITGGDTGLAQNATASAVMTMNDSSVWIGRNTVHIGLRGSGTLFMNDNSSLLAGAAAGNNFTIGGNSATTGRGWMEAADAARITAAGFARIGMQGTGVLILRDSATMTANAGVFLGMTAVTGSGAVTVADSAMLRSGAGFTIGENGAGVLTLRDGGAVQVASGTVVLARLGAASGRLEITGSRGGVITGTGAMGAAVIDGGPGTGGARVVFAHGDANYVFANRLAGTLSVEHTGAGFTTLTGANDYTGGTIVRGGTLAGTTDSVRGDITADGAVVLDVAAPGRTLALSGSGLFNKTGPGTLTLAVPTAFTGAVVVRGALALDAGASLDTARSITLADGALFAGSLARASGRTLAGSGTLTGSLSLSGATLALEPGHGPFTIGGDLDFASSTLALGLFANGDDIISVAGSFTASGANTIDLSYGMSGTYTLRGLAALDGSVITIGGASQIGTGARQNAVSTASGGDLIIDFQADISRLLTWTGGSSALWNMADENWAGSGNTDQFASLDTVVFDGAADAANPANRLITLASGTVRVSGMTVSGDEDYTFGGAGGISSGTLIITEPDNPENLAGATGGLIKSGAGTLTFANAGANNFAGGIQLSGGAIVFDDGAQLGAVAAGGGDAGIAFAASATLAGAGTLGAVSVAPAATASFAVDAGRSLTLASGLAGAGAVEKTGGGLLALDGDGGHAGGFTVSGGTLAARGAALRGPVVNNAAVVLHEETADGAYAGSMTGSGVLLKTGAGRLALTGTIALDRVIIAGGGLGLVHAARLDAATAITLSRGVLLSGAGSFTTPAFTNAGAIRVGRAADPAGPHDVMTLHGNYSGSDGEIHLDMSLNAAGVMEYDRFIINGDAAGVTHVTLQERPSADRLDGDTGLLPAFGDMLSVTGSTAPGAFVPAGVVEFGGGQYAWDPAAGNGAGGWATLVIEPASAIASLDAAALIIGKAAFGSLENRLLAARQTAAPREKQFWLAGFQRHEKLSTLRYDLHDAAPRADADTQGIQTGLDWMQKFPEYTFVFGFFADYAKSDLHLPRRTTASSVNSAGGGLYAMWEMEKWHVHAILRNARETFDIAAARAGTLETRGYSWGGLLAAGRDFQSAAGWRLEPEARLSYQMHNISDVTDSVGRRYVVESADSLEALASVRLAREFVIGNGVTLTPHLRAGWTCDFDGAGRMRVSGELFRNDFGDGGALVDFGLAAMLGRGVSAHLGGAWFRSKSTEGAHISAGFALAW